MQSLCPHCKTGLDIQPEWIGQQAECPCCHNQFIIQPAVAPRGQVRQCRMAEPDEDGCLNSRERKNSGSWSGKIAGVMIFLAAVTAIAIMTGFFMVWSFSINS